jgi:protein TonB
LLTNPHASSWQGERCCGKGDQFVMDTYNDNQSESDHCIASAAFPRPRWRIDSRIAAVPEHKKKQRLVSSRLQESDLFHDSLVVSGAKSRARNPWAAVGSVTLPSLPLLALVVIPLFHTDTLPQRETLTMLYVPPAGSNAMKLRAPKPSSTYTPTSITIPTPVDKTQEAPPPPVGTTGGVVGGAPGGIVGGVPGGLSSELLNSAASVPVLAKSAVPTPVKRMRIASRVAEANLLHEVPPQYPPEAGRARIEGTVVLMAVIGTDGSVKDVRVESGLPILAQAALDAVRQWRYKPYMVDGEPVEVDSRITINFTLSAS